MTQARENESTNAQSVPRRTGVVHPFCVSVVMTVKNDAVGTALTLESLNRQSRLPDEIIVVDGGSRDGTADIICVFTETSGRGRLISAPGANIARGRNIGVAEACGDIIATIDAGCRADIDWLANLIAPFERDSQTELVAGVYRVDPQTLFEEVVGLATMRGQLDPFDPDTFNPSARSMAMTKSLWQRAGGWPEWVDFSEDTLFDHKVRAMGAERRFAGDAVVHWRPRTSLRSLAKQFYGYGKGRGQTRIETGHFHYNLRNFALLAICAMGLFATRWALIPLIALTVYFYVFTFHHKAMRIAQRTHRLTAYPLCMVVMWTVLFFHTAGFLAGSWRRLRGDNKFAQRRESYLPIACRKSAAV